jgi:hypothetical protein
MKAYKKWLTRILKLIHIHTYKCNYYGEKICGCGAKKTIQVNRTNGSSKWLIK